MISIKKVLLTELFVNSLKKALESEKNQKKEQTNKV